MTTPQMPSAEHAQFDAICAPVDDFETLPTVAGHTLTSQYEAESGADDEPEDHGEDTFDDLILAALVAPY